ncbi:MAG: hypothetical protein AAFO06_01945 [Cyanobacteria bacterium J06597_16]
MSFITYKAASGITQQEKPAATQMRASQPETSCSFSSVLSVVLF